MKVDNRDELVELLILALIRLTARKERGGMTAWRSYDWDAIDNLQEQDLVRFSRRSKSITLTDEGERLSASAAETLGQLLEEMKGRPEGDGATSLPEVITNGYIKALQLCDEDVEAIEAAAEERRRYEELFEDVEEEAE